MDQIKIGKFIAERRKKQGLLQKDIAARLGISEKTISKWECGNGLPEVVYIEIKTMEPSSNGTGGLTYFMTTENSRLVVKNRR